MKFRLLFYFLLLLLLFDSACVSSQDKRYLEYLKLYHGLYTTEMYLNVCGYHEKNKNWPESKYEFEKFLFHDEKNISLYNRLRKINYGFLDYNEQNLLIYDFGPDQDDDHGVPLLELKNLQNDLKFDVDGDVEIMDSSKDCNFENFDLTIWFARQEEEVFDTLTRRKISKLIRDIKVLQYNLDENSVFVPKDGEKRKLTVLILTKENNKKWNSMIVYSNHQKENIEEIEKAILDLIENSVEIKEKKIDFIYIPIMFFEKNQLMKLGD